MSLEDLKEDIEEEDIEEEENIEINKKLYEAIKLMFKNEVNKIMKNINNKYGKEYNFNYDDLLEFFNKYDINLYYKKATEKPINMKKNIIEIDDKNRCCARIWAGGYLNKEKKQYGERCARKKLDDTDYCKQHLEDLTHGRFDEEPNKIIKGFYIKENIIS